MTQSMTAEQALAYFDGLDPVEIEQLIGDWRGEEIATGHPMGGMLSATRWLGKSFESADIVHPLVHTGLWGQRICVNPACLPIRLGIRLPLRRLIASVLFPLIRPFITTRRPKARLRMIMFRGKLSAAMIYDAKPIIDVFRRIDDNTVLGLMDQRDDATPFFFILSRL